jgi:subtilisin family serine protease
VKQWRNRMGIGFLLLVCLIAFSATGEDRLGQRLDPALRILMEEGLPLAEAGVSIQSLLESGSYQVSWSPTADLEQIGVLVRLDEAFRGTTFHGLPVTVDTGTILGVSATLPQILGLLDDERVAYIEPSRKTSITLDVSLDAVHADVVHAASPSVTGVGVIIGAIDTGIDYTHLDFRYDANADGFEESSRILAIFDQTFGLYGVKYTQQDIESDLANGYGPNEGIVRHKDVDGHGTHVMGIAAGDGSSSDGGFIGVAPDAWIVMVKTTFYTSDILAGVKYIFDLADDLGVPAVVNLSLGGHDGPHDGTSLFERGMDELVAGRGRAIVVSAGNEGDQSIHVSDTLRGGESTFRLAAQGWEAEMSLWYPGSSRFSITVRPPVGQAVAASYGTDTGVVLTGSGIVRIDNASRGTNPNNGDHEAFIRLSALTGTGQWQVTVTDTGGEGGRYDAWITSGSAVFADGNSSSTIDEPGNARGVITVGSFNSKAVWPSLSGEQNYLSVYPVGVLSAFSSQGPTRDGRMKPDLCAPGAWIGAALSAQAPWQGYLVHTDGVHTMELGTSMAAPHVSGAAALILSVNPRLSVDEVRALLTQAATRDVYTGAVPNTRWGWGKLNVAAAIAEVEPPENPVEPPPNGTGRPTVALAENPVNLIARFSFGWLEGTTSAELRIYDARGALVFRSTVHPSSNGFDWALMTSRGEPVASGLYLYVLVTNRGVSTIGRLVIAR